jgi:integrase
LPIIALHSGARLSEMAQLNVHDIVTQDGVRCFRVIDNPEDGQSIKNEVSHRLIPIHKRIIELGFFEYVATLDTDGRIFPLVRPDSHDVAGGLFSKWYGGYRHSIGIGRKGADFHAMRHHVKSLLRSIPGDDEVKKAIVGHADGNTSSDYGRISGKEMKKVVDRIHYDVTIPKWKATTVRRVA